LTVIVVPPPGGLSISMVEAETGVPVELEAGGFTVGQPVAAAPVPGRAIPA
jgi:hypothetical protein